MEGTKVRGHVVLPMLVWRLYNDHDDHADCSLHVTDTGAYRITLQCGDDLKFTALAVDWRAARQMIDDRREELLRQGWKPRMPLLRTCKPPTAGS